MKVFVVSYKNSRGEWIPYRVQKCRASTLCLPTWYVDNLPRKAVVQDVEVHNNRAILASIHLGVEMIDS